MGVPGLWTYMNRFGEVVDVEVLRGKVITIDGHIWLYEACRGAMSHGRAPTYISTFFKRVQALVECGIEPIVVFDGVTTDFTDAPLPNKVSKRSKRCGGKAWNMTAYTDLNSKVTATKNLLTSMGVRVVMGKEDGEAQCAQLEEAGISSGCITEDFDYFLYGGSNLYKIDFSKTKPTITMFSLERISRADQGSEFKIFNRNRLIALAMLLGNDYFEKGIGRVGVISALEILSEFCLHEDDHPTSILDRFRSYSTREIPERETDSKVKVKLREKFFYDAFPDGFPNSDSFIACVNVFLLPEVHKFDSVDCKIPDRPEFDRQQLQEVLETCAGWDKSRFDKELVRSDKRGSKGRTAAAQTKITNFFAGTKKRSQKVVEQCTESEGVTCSRREWGALTKMRRSHLEYSSMTVESQNVILTPPETPTPTTVNGRGQKRRVNGDDGEGKEREEEENRVVEQEVVGTSYSGKRRRGPPIIVTDDVEDGSSVQILSG